jgi:acyl transferase domain-containing protein/acyl carrier protein
MGNPLAIVGMGFRASGSSGPDELWELLRQRRDMVGPSPSRCWPELYDPNPLAKGKTVSRWGSFLADIDGMDWRFFGISPREARNMDPQHRLLLEVAWETLEDAGVPAARAAGSRAGVFIGIMLNDYGRLYGRNLQHVDGYTVPNNTFAYAANRISFFLDLRGPSMSIDTNCSSSLMAIHQACRSIWMGEADWALAGGVSLILTPDTDISLSKATTLSPTGRIRTWDAKADGTVRGEGVGLVLVKPLASALAAGDRIYATVLGTAANHKGRGNWIAEPSGTAQATAILDACTMAGIRPEDLDYVELHGTGTPKGDPIEAQGLGQVMGARSKSRPCRVGTIKTNLGHLDAAAGVAGFVKTALSIHRRELVASLNFEVANPEIDLDRLNLRVQTATEPWPESESPPTAGVTAIGFGGTNVHVVLRGVDAPEEPERRDRGSYVLPLSAKSPGALFALAERFAGWLEKQGAPTPSLEDIGYTVAARRTHHEQRLAVAGGSRTELAARLRESLPVAVEPRARSRRGTRPRPRLVFVFPGHGPQWLGMARDLFPAAPVFAQAMEACDALVHRETGWSVIAELNASTERSRLDEPAVVQPVLFAVATSLAVLYGSWGIFPDAVLGHSFGEIAAAVVSEAITLEEGVRIVCARGRLTQKRAGHGGVAIVGLPSKDVRELLLSYDALEIGGENSPTSTLVTGAVAQLDALVSELTPREVFARRVNMAYASHGRDMEGLLDEFGAALGPLRGRRTNALFCSTVDGSFVEGEALNTGYWLRNLREPVRYADAVRRVASDAESIFVEISPHPVLTSATRESLDGVATVHAIIPSLRRGHPSLGTLDECLSKLYVTGFNPNWGARYPAGRVVSTPSYAWQRERMWLETTETVRATPAPVEEHPLLGQRVDSEGGNALVWEQTIGGPETAYFRDHRLQDVPSASTSAMVEMMLAAASPSLGTEALEIVDLELLHAFVLPQDRLYRVQTVLTPGTEWTVEIRGRDPTRDGGFRTHSKARIRRATAAPDIPRFDAPFGERLTRGAVYEELAHLGIQYGPAFQGIEWLSREGEGVLAGVRMPDGLDARPYFFHPAFHDAAMHVALLALACREHTGFVPVRIRRIWIASRPADELRSHARVTQLGQAIRADVRIEKVDGSLVELIEGVELAHLDDAIAASDISSEETSWLYGIDWRERAPSAPRSDRAAEDDPGKSREGEASNEPASPVGPWLVLADTSGIGSALAARIRASGQRALTLTLDSLGGPGLRSTRDGDARKEHLVRGIRLAVGPEGSLAGVVHLWNVDLPELEGIESAKLDAALVDGCDSAFSLLRALEETFPASRTPVWFVTRGAQPWSLEASDMAPLQAALWGLGRTIAAELTARWGGLVDLDPTKPAVESAASLWEWMRDPREGEDEVLFRNGGMHVGRLTRRAANDRPRKLDIRPDGSYLVTGGTGGLGLEVSKWLASRGARHLVLVARTPLPPREAWTEVAPESPFAETIDAIRKIEALGAAVRTVALDISNEPAVIAFLDDHERRDLPPFRGVLHLAGTVHMEEALRLDASALLDAVRPKIHGVLPLHGWLEDLDFFVLFSSAASVIRSPRLSHYAAGNAFLDALAHYRHARGEPASAINWGLWRDVGFIRRLDDRGPGAMGGMKSMAPEEGIRILEHLVASGDVQTVVWPPDWKEWAERYPSFRRSSFVAELLNASAAPGSQAPAQRLGAAFNALPKERRPSAVTAYIAREIAERLRSGVDELEVDLPLERLGFDSLQATELQARLLEDLGVRIPVMRFLGFSSIASIAQEVVERLENVLPLRPAQTVWPMLESDVRRLVGGAESVNTDDDDDDERLQGSGE